MSEEKEYDFDFTFGTSVRAKSKEEAWEILKSMSGDDPMQQQITDMSLWNLVEKENRVSIDDYETLADVISGETGIFLTYRQVDEILSKTDIIHDIKKWGASDTVVRENFLTYTGFYITGNFWPEHKSTKEERDEYIKNMRMKASLIGYKVKKNE